MNEQQFLDWCKDEETEIKFKINDNVKGNIIKKFTEVM